MTAAATTDVGCAEPGVEVSDSTDWRIFNGWRRDEIEKIWWPNLGPKVKNWFCRNTAVITLRLDFDLSLYL